MEKVFLQICYEFLMCHRWTLTTTKPLYHLYTLEIYTGSLVSTSNIFVTLIFFFPLTVFIIYVILKTRSITVQWQLSVFGRSFKKVFGAGRVWPGSPKILVIMHYLRLYYYNKILGILWCHWKSGRTKGLYLKVLSNCVTQTAL